MTPRILLLQGAAIAASLFQLLVSLRISLYGPEGAGPMTLVDGVALFSIALLYGWWTSPVAAAPAGIRGAMLALAVLPLYWAFWIGAYGVVTCVPTCDDPLIQQVAHALGALSGSGAVVAAWLGYRRMPGPTQRAPVVTAILLMVFATFAVAAAYAARLP